MSKNMNGNIIVIAEHSEGQVAPITYELLAMADEIKQLRSLDLKVIVLGSDPEGLSKEIAQSTGASVIAVRNQHLESYNAELYKQVLSDMLPQFDPVYVIAGQTTQGMDMAPGLSVRLEAGCITGVEAVMEIDNKICFSRSVHNGKIMLEMMGTSNCTVLTVQPGAFKAEEKHISKRGSIEIRDSKEGPKKTKSLGVKIARQEDAGLAEADIIVAAGRGIGEQENLEIIERLAGLFPRSAIAASRPLCDNEWLEYKRQVGLTGATVSPKLYLACGISGAIQHTVGMQGSGFIVAISTDPNAAIFNIADVCIVEDLKSFIPTFISEYENE